MRKISIKYDQLPIYLPTCGPTRDDCYTNSPQLLGIDKQASEKDMKRAYRTLSKKYHPDKNPYGFPFPLALCSKQKSLHDLLTPSAAATRKPSRNSLKSPKPTKPSRTQSRAKYMTNTAMKVSSNANKAARVADNTTPSTSSRASSAVAVVDLSGTRANEGDPTWRFASGCR